MFFPATTGPSTAAKLLKSTTLVVKLAKTYPKLIKTIKVGGKVLTGELFEKLVAKEVLMFNSKSGKARPIFSMLYDFMTKHGDDVFNKLMAKGATKEMLEGLLES